jgi:hypothetical protein
MKYRQSKILGNEVFDEYRHFLSKNHKYRTTEKYLLNGKQDTGLKPQRMTPCLWKLAYDRINPRGTHFFYVSCWPLTKFWRTLVIFDHFWDFDRMVEGFTTLFGLGIM